MGLKLYNTLTRSKADFAPIDPGNVRLYVCGPTVYDFAHIGNARPLIVFDVLFRLLRHLYGPEHVTYVRNITDVDDKIIARAAESHPDLPLNQAIGRVTKSTEEQFHADAKALGCLEPTHEPRATVHIDDMKAMIETLVAKGAAYVAEDHVLFAVASMADYGKLSNRTRDDMIAGARVEVAPYKRDPMDFVLWKPSKPGEPAWPSPAGIATPGRPGWHLECSAMSDRWLWQEVEAGLSAEGRARPHEFDIHGGGIDLCFPHHENEIAQSRSAFGTPSMAHVWMHNGFLQVEGEKMSKSLGNFVTIRALLDEWPGDVLRLNMLKTHYQKPINWTETNTILSSQELEDWGATLQPYFDDGRGEVSMGLVKALSDDLNTPAALSVLRELHHKARAGGPSDIRDFAASCRFIGFRNLGRPGYFQYGISGLNVSRENLFAHEKEIIRYRAATANDALETASAILAKVRSRGLDLRQESGGYISLTTADRASDSIINDLIGARKKARQQKNFAEADRIRDELAAMGIQLMDAKDPDTGELVTTWEVKR